MRKLPRLVIVLGFVSLLTDMSSEMILPMLPALLLGASAAGGMGATTVAVGLVDGIADAVAAVLKLISGRLSDASPRRKPFVLLGYTLSTVVRPLMSVAAAPWHILAVRAVDRVGKGVRSAPRDALIADVVAPVDAPRAYAFHRMMDHTGAIFGPLVAAALLAVGLTAREAIAAAWIPGALAVLALLLFVREPPRAIATQGGEQASPASRVALPRSLHELLAVFGLFSLGFAGDTFILVRAFDLQVAPPLLPLLWSVLHIAKVAAAAAVGKRNTSSTAVLVGAWGAVAAGLALLTVDVVGVIWPAAFLVGLGHGAREPIEKALVRARAPDTARGRAFGAYHLVTGLAALPSGLAIGALWHAVGGEATLLASAGVVGSAALILLAHVRARR